MRLWLCFIKFALLLNTKQTSILFIERSYVISAKEESGRNNLHFLYLKWSKPQTDNLKKNMLILLQGPIYGILRVTPF